ncbi:DnaJ C-terminal domain-containing protein [Nitrosomonas sp. Nm166]|uniref:DnaJ C-terminal domain-containing protein n=1 Tax=Nitrosomonas sp. Nm166 TaxID=1881054 RepID=UPI0008E5CB96|nr:DnaJ C-terminal domain-containing protein [Nitrosomonas sp. Nm166]SFE23824.1 molecular chaperone DnaJ [Nitrosomonas sp. Nm166]
MLGIAKNADQKEIKDAFHNLAMKYHPDRNKEAGAEERFKEIAEAYAILSNPQKRAEYDARGFAGVAGTSQEDLFSTINFDDIFGGINFDFGADSLLGGFFGRRRKGPPHGANIEIDLYITLDRIARGGEEVVHFKRPVTCYACHGTGGEGGAAPRQCEACSGTGRITHSQRKEKDHVLIQHIVPCSICSGRGSINEHPCPECCGSGELEQAEELTVKIPVGAEEGMALRIPGKGMPSLAVGGVNGDLLVLIRSRPDPRFERSGADLLHTEALSLPDAVLGTTLKVPTLLNGWVDVTVPPGTQSDTILRLKRKRLPEFGGNRQGDLYLRISLWVPQHLSNEERELYERLRAISNQTH